MASRKAVVAALTLLSRAFAGEVTHERIEVYTAALDDVTDAQLAVAIVEVIKRHEGAFFPPPAVLRKAAGVGDAPAVDVDGILRELSRMGSYSPNGWLLPRIGEVREALGDAVAYAAAEVGLHRLCADDTVTRDIAARDFAQALRLEAEERPDSLPAWANLRLQVTAPKQLTDGAP
jgi:hypothetical protein